MALPAIFVVVIFILICLMLMNNYVRMNNNIKRILNAMILFATAIWLAGVLGFLEIFTSTRIP